MVVALGGKSSKNFSFSEVLASFESYKNAGNAPRIKQTLGLDEGRFNDFLKALRKLHKHLKSDSTNVQNERAIQIASLRLLDWFEYISSNGIKEFTACKPAFGSDLDDRSSIKQVRAAELVIRSLMSEKYLDQNNLDELIREYFSKDDKAYQDIKRKAKKGDVLSGTDFSQLIALFLKPDEFQSKFSSIFESSLFLDYLRNKRETLGFYLDDIRRIRNDIAHVKTLSFAQIELLDIYYEEIMTPIQEAHDKKNTFVNPKQHLKADDAQLNEYRELINNELTKINKGLTELSGNVGWIRRNLKGIIISLFLLILILIFATYSIRQVNKKTEIISTETAIITSDASNTKHIIEQDPSTIGLINLKLIDAAENTSSSKSIQIWAAIYLNVKEISFKNVMVKAIINSTSSQKSVIDISDLLAQSNAVDAQTIQFSAPADTAHIFMCMTTNHPTLQKPYTAVWSYAFNKTGNSYTVVRDRPALLREGSIESCF